MPTAKKTKPELIVTHASHLRDIIVTPGKLATAAKKLLTGVEFDTMVGTGVSGALALPLLSARLKKNYAIVRKAQDTDNHSARTVEGRIGKRWLFVDDLIDSGRTLRRVIEQISQLADKYSRPAPVFVGCFLYYGIVSGVSLHARGYIPASEISDKCGIHLPD